MRTKSHIRFLNRIAHFEADVELADVIAIANGNGVLSTSGSKHLFDQVESVKHPRLSGRVNNAHNRRLAVNHLKATLCASFLKDVYEDLTAYLNEILEAAARNGLDPNRLIGEHKVQLDANEILQAKSWNAVVHLVARSVFRQMESKKSTKELIAKMNAKLDLGVSQKVIDDALPYLEMRHLLVHSDGKADADFCKSFPKMRAVAGTKIPLDFPTLLAARTSIMSLVNEIDSKVVSKKVVSTADLNQ